MTSSTKVLESNGTVRMPWQLAWALASLLFVAGFSWARQEINAAESKVRIESMQMQLIDQANRLAKLESSANAAAGRLEEMERRISGRRTP